jgi:DNA modification methylase
MNERVLVLEGDCLAVMDTLSENSVDAVVTDPPYHLTSIVKRYSSASPAKTGERNQKGVIDHASFTGLEPCKSRLCETL